MNRNVVLGHARLSWGEQDSSSPARQESAIRAWAQRNGFDRVELFADVEGRHSGRKHEGRPEWSRLRQRVGDPQTAVVVVESVDRLFRNLKLLLAFVDDCVAQGVRFVSIAENFDFKPPSQADNPLEEAMRRMALQQFGALAEAWSNMTSAKMQMKIAAWREEGKYWGIEPFGTKRDERDRLAPDTRVSYWWHPEQGTVTDAPMGEGWQARTYHYSLLRCYELYGEDREGWGGIAQALMSEGCFYKDRWGKPRIFLPDDVRRALDTHLTYEGHLIRERSDTAREAVIVKAGAWEPILPPAVIHRAMNVLEGRRKAQAHVGNRATFPLTRLLYCTHCRRHLNGQTSAYGVKSYRHNHRCEASLKQINAEQIEREVNQLIRDIILPPDSWDALESLVQQILIEEAESPDTTRLTSLKTQRDNLKKTFLEQQQYGVTVMTWGELAAQLKPLESEINATQERVAARSVPPHLRSTLNRLHNVADIIEKASVTTQRELYAGLFHRLDVDLSTGEIASWKPTPWVDAYVQTVLRCGKVRIKGFIRANHAVGFAQRMVTLSAA